MAAVPIASGYRTRLIGLLSLPIPTSYPHQDLSCLHQRHRQNDVGFVSSTPFQRAALILPMPDATPALHHTNPYQHLPPH